MRAGSRGRRSIIAALFTIIAISRWLAADAAAAEPPDATIFRIFLTNGAAIVSYGEYARVGDRVIFSVPLGAPAANPPLHVVNLPASAVDWPSTERYAESARYARYAATRAESDFAILSGEIAEALNSVALASGPAERLAIAQRARQRLVEWPRHHYGYRAADVAQIAAFLDEAISELRAAAGETRFDLNLVASAAAPSTDLLMPLPTTAEAFEQAFTVARVADVPAERLSLLQSIAVSLGGATAELPAAWATRTRLAIDGEISRELDIEQAYSKLTTLTLRRAAAYAEKADVRGVERLLADVAREDERLGRLRPEYVTTLVQTLEARLHEARQFRLAYDQWVLRAAAYRRYRREVSSTLTRLDAIQPRLEDIRTLAGPSAGLLTSLAATVARARAELSRIGAPDELLNAHTLLVSAVSLADVAISTRRDAIASGNLRTAWDAAAAAAGSLMLVTRARSELEARLEPPRLR